MDNIMPTQAYFIKQFTDKHREDFNEKLFIRDDNAIIEDLKKVVLSCERNRHFILKVQSFRVVDDYKEILDILYRYEEGLSKNRKKRRENPYEYVDLKNTDLKLLIVTYYIQVKDEFKTVDVIIGVPRIVDKYYFRISGNIYSALYQIVDGSTYNNSTSSNAKKKDSVSLKAMFMSIRAYKNNAILLTTRNEEIKTTFYTLRIFNKSFNSIKPFLAKLGLYKGLMFLGINCITITDIDPNNDDLYTFENNNIFINVPKYLFDNDPFIQSVVYSIYININNDCTYNAIFSKYYWMCSLGGDFNNFSPEKGLSILDSLESIYDIITKESIHLPMDGKDTIYNILRWMLREFPALKSKDNLDISTKRIRYSEYIASLYAMKLSTGIYRITDDSKNVTIDNIEKIIKVSPMYLLSAITKCNLVNYRNMVNDLDSTTALEYTYKGISGIGNENSKSVPKIFRYIHHSHLGRVDLDSSPKSDPGMSGVLCPLTNTYEDSFSEYEEPNFWESEFDKLTKTYKALVGKKEVIKVQRELLNIRNEKSEDMIEDSIENVRQLMTVIRFAEDDEEIPQDLDIQEEEDVVVNE